MLWPVHAHELKKLLPMLFMFFCISFNYTVLRDTKDTLIVTASGSGAEAIPFLKVWGVVPGAIIFTLIYSKFSNLLSRERLFYTSLTPFIVFFGLFAAVIYPNREALHPTASADWLQSALPSGFSGLIALYRNWTYALFYIMAELWGSVGISLLFWGFANQTTRVSEAKRFYALFGLGANLALLFSGPAIVYVTDIRSRIPAGIDAWGVSLNYLMSMVVALGVLAMAIYYWINRNVLTDPRFYDPNDVKKSKKKPSMGLVESFKYLASSKYILCLTLLVLSYGIAINLIEVTWKGQLKLQYPNPNDYGTFMGYFSTVTGAVTLFMMMFVGGNLLRMKGWGFTAMTTPVVLVVTGAIFFSFVLGKDSLMGMVAVIGSTPLMIAVVVGAIQNIMSKASKYSLFDPTKEMAYIPLDEESKVKGKAAIDVVGARLGKSGGAFIQQGLLIALGSMAAITPWIAGALFVIIVIWMLAVHSLNKQFVTLTTKKPVAAPAAEPVLATVAVTK